MNIFTEIGILRQQIQVIYEFIVAINGGNTMFTVESLKTASAKLTTLVEDVKAVVQGHVSVNDEAEKLTKQVEAKLAELEKFLETYKPATEVTTFVGKVENEVKKVINTVEADVKYVVTEITGAEKVVEADVKKAKVEADKVEAVAAPVVNEAAKLIPNNLFGEQEVNVPRASANTLAVNASVASNTVVGSVNVVSVPVGSANTFIGANTGI
jgi:cysteinyl-tRNA synthetase